MTDVYYVGKQLFTLVWLLCGPRDSYALHFIRLHCV